MIRPFLLGLLFLASGATFAHASLLISAFDTTTTIDFESTVAGVNNGTFDGSGFTSTPGAGQLDSDAWRVTGMSDGDSTFGGTSTSGDSARGTDADGGVSTGGVYAFTSAGNTFLGVQPISSDFTPGDFTLRIQNTTGSTVGSWDLSFDRYVNNDEERGNNFNWAFSTDDISYTAIDTFTSTAASDGLGFQSTTVAVDSLSATVANNGFLYLQWQGDDFDGSGSRDEFGIDNISITAVIPEPSSVLVLGFFCGLAALRRRRRALGSAS